MDNQMKITVEITVQPCGNVPSRAVEHLMMRAMVAQNHYETNEIEPLTINATQGKISMVFDSDLSADEVDFIHQLPAWYHTALSETEQEIERLQMLGVKR